MWGPARARRLFELHCDVSRHSHTVETQLEQQKQELTEMKERLAEQAQDIQGIKEALEALTAHLVRSTGQYGQRLNAEKLMHQTPMMATPLIEDGQVCEAMKQIMQDQKSKLDQTELSPVASQSMTVLGSIEEGSDMCMALESMYKRKLVTKPPLDEPRVPKVTDVHAVGTDGLRSADLLHERPKGGRYASANGFNVRSTRQDNMECGLAIHNLAAEFFPFREQAIADEWRVQPEEFEVHETRESVDLKRKMLKIETTREFPLPLHREDPAAAFSQPPVQPHFMFAPNQPSSPSRAVPPEPQDPDEIVSNSNSPGKFTLI